MKTRYFTAQNAIDLQTQTSSHVEIKVEHQGRDEGNRSRKADLSATSIELERQMHSN
jgi:hypothetical protein